MSQSSNDIFILDGARTAIGSTFKALKDFSASQLGAVVIKGVLARNRISGDILDQIIFGNTVSAGTGQSVARLAGFLAGVPVTVPAFNVNNVCGSGLQAVILAAQAIRCAEAQIILAGGSESASQSPYILKKGYKELKEENLVDSAVFDGLTCQLTGKHMGELAEVIVKKFNISRQEQDRYSFDSHKKALAAMEKEKFLKEIIPVGIKESQSFSVDQRPRKNIDLEKLSHLPPAFIEGGSVTAGNSSIPSDGAAALILASGEAVKEEKFKPLARILGYASVAVEPQLVFTAAIPAIKTCLKKCRLTLSDIDLFEISEAFAAQAILARQELKIPGEKMNIFGGDVALGHPLGAAGERALVTLIHALRDQKKKRGLAVVCLGGGGGVAVAVEVID